MASKPHQALAPLFLGLIVLAVISACSSAASNPTSTSPGPSTPFPAASDGSIVTPSGFVFRADFAICNQAKCTRAAGSDLAKCDCEKLTDTWTLSPVPAAALASLTSPTQLLSTFTTANLSGVNALPCSGGVWADCYGSTCEVDSESGAVTCECPVIQGAFDWIKYVKDCESGSCNGPVSAAPSFPGGSDGLSDFAAAIEQVGDQPPAPADPCTSDGSSTSAACAEGFNIPAA